MTEDFEDLEIEDVDDECYYLKKLHESEIKIKRLQEQIEEANELIKDYVHDANDCFTMGRIRKYLERWQVK